MKHINKFSKHTFTHIFIQITQKKQQKYKYIYIYFLCNLILDKHVQSVMGHFSCRHQLQHKHTCKYFTLYLNADDIINNNNNNPLIFER